MAIRFAGLGRVRRSIVGALAILATVLASPSLGQQPAQGGDPGGLEAIKRTLDEAEAATARGGLWPQALIDLRRTVAAAREELRARIADLEPRVAEAEARLRQLGAPPAKDAPRKARRSRPSARRLDAAFSGARRSAQADAAAGRSHRPARRPADANVGRALYARELFERSASVLNPSFWIEAADALPEHMRNLGALIRWWASAVRDRGPLPIAGSGAAVCSAIGFAAAALTRWWLPRFDIRSSAETRLAKARTGVVVFLWLAAAHAGGAVVAGLFVLQALGTMAAIASRNWAPAWSQPSPPPHSAAGSRADCSRPTGPSGG